jgi:predicted double-glycine peptidase
MRWLLFVVVLLLSAAAFGVGYRVQPKGRRLPAVTVAVGLAFVLLRALVRYGPEVEYQLLPFDFYAIIHPWWAFPFAFLILGVGVREMSTPFSRKAVGVFAGLLFLVAVQRLWITARFDPTTLHGVVNQRRVCNQTTDYSCGAASAVMLLDQLGLRSTEREMAELCWTNGLTGTDELGVCMGLRKKLAGTPWRPNLVRSDWDDLRRRGGPAMATIYHSFMVDHWVLVLEVTDDRVVVLDPIASRQTHTKARFLELWRRSLVVAEKS